MEYKDIIKRIDLAINNIKHNHLINDFPDLVNDLYFMYNELGKVISELPEEEIFIQGNDIEEKVIEYFSILTNKYIKLKYNTDINIELECGYNMVSISAGAYDAKEDKIKYSSFGLLLNKVNISSYLQTFLHESKHKMQHDSYLTNNINKILSTLPNGIILAKEFAYSKGKQNQTSDFYMENYNRLYTETDAEVFSVNTLKIMITELFIEYNKFIKQNNIPQNKDLDAKIRIIKKEMIADATEIEQNQKKLGRLSLDIIKEIYGISPIVSEYTQEGQTIDRLIELDKYIKSHPEIQESMPIFKLIFNGDKPKTYDEIIIDKQKLMSKYPEYKKEIDTLYQNIIVSDPILYLTHLIENNKNKLLINFINNHPTIIVEYQQEITYIVDKYPSKETIQLLSHYNSQKKK